MVSTSICLKTSPKRIIFKLRFYREAVQMGQKLTADKLNISHRSYQRIESGEANCDISFLYRYCNLFKIDFNSLASPYPPIIDSGMQLFINEVDFKKFKSTKLIQESKMVELSQKINSKKKSFGNIGESSEFLNSEFNLYISTPYKNIFNNKAIESFHSLKIPNQTNINFSDIHEQVNFWDCLYCYCPKYSIKKNFIMDVNGKKIEFLEFTVHVYQKENITNISLIQFL